jgi:hypothetical protein
MGTAPMLAPRNLRLFQIKAAHGKTPTIPHHLRSSRQLVRNHFRYRIDTLDRWTGARMLAGWSNAICRTKTPRNAELKRYLFLEA